MITVNFFTTLRLMLGLGELHLTSLEDASILEVLQESERLVKEKTSKKFLFKLLDENQAIKRGTIILINGRNILDMEEKLQARVKTGDTIALFPPGGGG